MPDERFGSRLSSAAFKREQLGEAERRHVENTFGAHAWAEERPGRWRACGAERLVEEVVQTLGDGKEATVYRCAMDRRLDFEWAVAKVYRATKFRAFAGTNQYLDAERVHNSRQRRALRGRTKIGRRIAHRLWIEREWETLCLLHEAGADVPAPYAWTTDAILMEYIGDDEGPAPLLLHCRLGVEASCRAFADVLRNLELLLDCERVHGDLSAYNILWQRGRITIIDLPQAVDARSPNAYELLARDVRNVCGYFWRSGVSCDPEDITSSLWERYLRAGGC